MKSDTPPLLLEDGATIHPLIRKILLRRGISTNMEIKAFLQPKLHDLPDPYLMSGMKKAVQLMGQAMVKKKQILIWGDYDVDGVTSTALLLLFFETIGYANVTYHIPNRLEEGYGLKSDSLLKFCKKFPRKIDLLITVDNGISAHNAIIEAKKLGLDVIVTDHHSPPAEKVMADAILNPKQTECDFPGKELAGVGVAFYLLVGLRSYLREKKYFPKTICSLNLKNFLDLVAIGTVSDMVHLDNVNRILIRGGLEVLSTGNTIGLKALCSGLNLDPTRICAEDISFQIAPKINAAGRLGHADLALSLLTCNRLSDANRLVEQLIIQNETRKNITLEDYANAKHYILKNKLSNRNAFIVAGDFHIGVAGIVASKLVEKYNKVSIVLCRQENNIFKGSARSVAGVDLYEALVACAAVLLSFGGHAMAAGLTVEEENLNVLGDVFEKVMQKQLSVYDFSAEQEEAAENIGIQELFNGPLLDQLFLLEPHGIGNPQPVFLDTTTQIAKVRQIGRDKSHLQLQFTSINSGIYGVGFGLGELKEQCETEQVETIFYRPAVNFFKGRRSWQVRIENLIFQNGNILK